MSDKDLITELSGREIPPRRMHLFVRLSSLLRLMDSFLVGSQTGEEFVAKFSEDWLSIDDWESGEDLVEELLEIDVFYGRTHRFCCVPEHRDEEPVLFGVDRLRKLAHEAYNRLRQSWYQSITQGREER